MNAAFILKLYYRLNYLNINVRHAMHICYSIIQYMDKYLVAILYEHMCLNSNKIKQKKINSKNI